MRAFIICMASLMVGSIALAAEPHGPMDDWVNISDPITNQLKADNVKIPWPGMTAGITVDRTTGQVYLEIAGVGLWTSTDQGKTFTRIAENKIGGRCEYAAAFNADPGSSRLACFMLDGKGGLTADGGKTWQSFADVGRNWDFAAIDWSDPQAKTIFAARHEHGGDIYLSTDTSQSWTLLGRHPEIIGVGIFDSHTLVAATHDGILRSTDAGKTFTKISDLHPTSRVAITFKEKTYWLATEGLLTTTDKGATWQTIGPSLKDAGWGPFFGQTESEMIIATKEEILQTKNAGQTWAKIADLPPFKAFPPKQPGQFLSLAWDPQTNTLYASQMANPAYKLQLK